MLDSSSRYSTSLSISAPKYSRASGGWSLPGAFSPQHVGGCRRSSLRGRGADGNKTAKWVVKIYVEICRGVPLLVILYFTYFLLPGVGISLPAFWAAVFGLTFNLGAYLSEVFRASIEGDRQGTAPGGHGAGDEASPSIARSSCRKPWRSDADRRRLLHLALKDCSLVSVIAVEELLLPRQIHHYRRTSGSGRRSSWSGSSTSSLASARPDHRAVGAVVPPAYLRK